MLTIFEASFANGRTQLNYFHTKCEVGVTLETATTKPFGWPRIRSNSLIKTHFIKVTTQPGRAASCHKLTAAS